MKSGLKDFSESAKGFTKSPLGIIALFIVLVYGFASLVVSFGQNLTGHITPLIYFLVIFPVIVFFGFLWLVSKHHKKLYGPSDFQYEKNFLKMQMSTVASLAAASAKNPEKALDDKQIEHQINSIVEMVAKAPRKERKKEGPAKILWVDDRPADNIYERQAFEAIGISFDLAMSTDEAMDMLAKEKYSAIISDMGRKEGPKEGYVLLEKLREHDKITPFFIYAGSNKPEHKKMAKEKGVQGCTNNPQELYEIVTSYIGHSS